MLDERSAPGRAIVDGLETQIAVLGGTSNVAEQTKLLAQLAEELRARGAREVAEIGALPTRLAAAELPDRVDELPVLGIAEDTLAPREFDPVGTFVVAGPPQVGQDERDEGAHHVDGALRPGGQALPLRRPALAAARTSRPWVRSAVDGRTRRRTLATELAEIVADESHPGAAS